MAEYTSFNLDLITSTGDTHTSNKMEFFKRGLPFYTCIDANANLYKKELPNGTSITVKRERLGQDDVEEKVVTELEMA